MNEIDILKSIAENLSERKSTAALNNYEVLCNNIKYVNDLLNWGTNSLKTIQNQIDSFYKNDNLVNEEFKNSTKPLFYFRSIVPRILLNDISIIEKIIIYTQSDDRSGISIENVGKLKKTFIDFNNLSTSARQFIDSLVSDAYQLSILDPKSTNFQVLTSLNSFNKYATKSIRHGLFNEQIINSLREFESLSSSQRNGNAVSHITKCEKKTFRNKLDFLFDNLNISAETDFNEEINNFYSFSCEFTHIGYVSTFFTNSNVSEVIFGDNIGPYLPSTENFSELKYELLETATKFFVRIYLPSLISSIKKSFENETFLILENSINQIISKITNGLTTRNNEYYFPIVQGLIGSKKPIDLTCMCGTINHWEPPHDLSKTYCKSCGSKFAFLEIAGDPGYIFTSNGPFKVIGSSVPDIDKLPIDKQIELFKKWEETMKIK